MKTIVIIGDGGWGTALAVLLAGKGLKVRVWGPFEDYIATVKKERCNPLYLPGVELPPEIVWTADRAEAAHGAEAAVLAVPSRFYKAVVTSFAAELPLDCLVISVSKGLEPSDGRRLTQTAAEALAPRPVAVLSGPTFAEEVARRMPAAAVVASSEPESAKAAQELFMTPRFRVYTSDDVAGVELGGALKNIIAVAAGANDGLGLGDNARAALITRGLAEVMRLGCALGARRETFFGLSGMGDLVLTCTSNRSRNRTVGLRLGRGESIRHIIGEMKQVAEGVWNCGVARRLAAQLGVAVPITDEVHAVINEGKSPVAAMEALMTRQARPEQD